ncbi:apyrase [Copidosoma floridanum]|uniref:apyrase n=1 Tax=Copidosoma floridanum TaxID=29053 RepID=UPI0006C95789|nr:apyrase [Copidosoma floridanum]XP_014218117.1 apyrase [Copidosoma floridanum]
MSWNLGLLYIGAIIFCVSNAFTVTVHPLQDKYFELSVIHFNDFHARFVETSAVSGTCRKTDDCIAGLARLLTESRKLMRERPNAIFLNAGDHYMGTLWYNVHTWNATVYFLNKLPHDAINVGNHDFDDGIEGLVPFLQRFNKPVVVTNIDDSEEPTIQGYFKNSTIITRGNQRIGVIGVILQSTSTLAKTGKLKFLDEIESVNAEATRLKAKGVDIIIVLSHCGLDVDRKIAANCPDIDVIVGGHSHTFLYTGTPPFNDKPEDEYPVVVKQNRTDRTVLIVQAAAFTKYLGNLTVWFDSRGEVADWEGNPILLDKKIVQDPELLEELKPWQEAVDAKGLVQVGVTESFLNGTYCRAEECNLANLITDAMVYAYVNKSDNPNYWTYAAISCTNAGGVRNDILPGPITYGDVATVQPFDNTWDVVELKGEDLRTTLEESVAFSKNPKQFWGVRFLQWSGVRVVYNLTKPAYSRIVSVKVRCQKCSQPVFEVLHDDEWYRLILPTFVLNQGDNITTIAMKQRNHQIGRLDVPQIINYIEKISPVDYKVDGRLTLLGNCCG